MSNYNSLKATIHANIKQNGRQEITGQILNSILYQMVNILGTGYQFAGVATTATNPGYPDAKVFYIANGKGTYTNFGGLEVTEDDVVILYWDSSWHKEATGIASQAKLTELKSKVYQSTASEQIEKGTIGGSQLQYETQKINITDNMEYCVRVSNITNPEMYIIWSDETFLHIYNNVWSKMTYPSGKTFRCIRILGDAQGVDIDIKVFLKPTDWSEHFVMPIAEEVYSQKIQNVNDSILESKVLIAEKEKNAKIYSNYLKTGNTIVIEVLGASSGDAEQDGISFYGFLADGTSDTLWNAPKGGHAYKEITLSKDYDYINVYSNPSIVQYNYKISIVSFLYDDVKRLEMQIGVYTTPMRVLVLGDSYSQNGGLWMKPMMQELPQGSSYISLAVSAATIKDRYADRATYPYTSRPVSTDNAGNHNTLACQIEKLKRLMQGTDLDDGETAIYQSAEEYPNVIIIEGGINDKTDTEKKVSTYHSQLDKIVENVYRKRKSSDAEATLGSVTIKTPIDEVDRTCFAGAYRYLADELLQLFPNAQIYITTCSPLDYRNGNPSSVQITTKAEQQRLCSDIFAFNLIDWHRDGQINSITNYAKGEGTEANPYIWGELDGEYVDTKDQLHPNARGYKKYGRLAALRIKQTFLNIGDL